MYGFTDAIVEKGHATAIHTITGINGVSMMGVHDTLVLLLGNMAYPDSRHADPENAPGFGPLEQTR